MHIPKQSSNKLHSSVDLNYSQVTGRVGVQRFLHKAGIISKMTRMSYCIYFLNLLLMQKCSQNIVYSSNVLIHLIIMYVLNIQRLFNYFQKLGNSSLRKDCKQIKVVHSFISKHLTTNCFLCKHYHLTFQLLYNLSLTAQLVVSSYHAFYMPFEPIIANFTINYHFCWKKTKRVII